jgi:hypothetical protein
LIVNVIVADPLVLLLAAARKALTPLPELVVNKLEGDACHVTVELGGIVLIVNESPLVQITEGPVMSVVNGAFVKVVKANSTFPGVVGNQALIA